MVIGGDSCQRGRKFESQPPDTRWIVSSHLFPENLFWCLKRPKINEKEAGDGIVFFKKTMSGTLLIKTIERITNQIDT